MQAVNKDLVTSAKAEKTSKNNVKLVSQLKYPIKGMNRLGFHSNVVAVKEKIMKFFSGFRPSNFFMKNSASWPYP